MLIPNLKFLVLPLVALAVIAGLPSQGTGKSQVGAHTTVAPAAPATGCDSSRRPSNCTVAMQPSVTVVR
jgi:hypothetical protein